MTIGNDFPLPISIVLDYIIAQDEVMEVGFAFLLLIKEKKKKNYGIAVFKILDIRQQRTVSFKDSTVL